jgi:hypothetical protein
LKYTLLMLIFLVTLSCLSQGEVQEKRVTEESVVEEPPVQEEEAIIVAEPEPDPAPEPIPEPEPITEPEPEAESEAELEAEITITTYRVPPSSQSSPLDQIELPLPEYIISFYPYLPLGESSYNPHVDLAYPTYRKPTPPAAEPVRVKEEVKDEPKPEEESTPETVKEIREERYSSGIPIPLVLEGTDWVYLGEENSEDTGFQDRKVLTDRTLFTFSFPEARTYILLFSRQNHSTGDSEQEKIRVVIEADSDKGIQKEESPESIVPLEPAAEPVQETRENLETLEAQARLQEIEENPEEAEESLELLEFLVNVESDDETLAGYYYRMARVLEMNSKVQDLNKAYDTYKYIIDHFFLTDYYELSEERIRFLDRHFFKLR